MSGLRETKRAHRALAEVERLIRDAEAGGVTLDPWLSELADELREALEGPIDPARIARLIGEEPVLAFAAQSRAGATGRDALTA